MLSKTKGKALAVDLRLVAKKYWSNAVRGNDFGSGICLALSNLRLNRDDYAGEGSTYADVSSALRLMQARWKDEGGGYLPSIHSDFRDDRAWMCLFMAEWLEREFLS